MRLIARREPTTDDVLKKYAPGIKRYDVVFYREDLTVYARWQWFQNPPRQGRNFAVLNSFRWKLVWLPGLQEAVGQ